MKRKLHYASRHTNPATKQSEPHRPHKVIITKRKHGRPVGRGKATAHVVFLDGGSR